MLQHRLHIKDLKKFSIRVKLKLDEDGNVTRSKIIKSKNSQNKSYKTLSESVMRAINHPVVGDRDYDGGRPGLDPGRPFLHAAYLLFRHPVSHEAMSFEASLPDDLSSVLGQLS